MFDSNDNRKLKSIADQKCDILRVITRMIHHARWEIELIFFF